MFKRSSFPFAVSRQFIFIPQVFGESDPMFMHITMAGKFLINRSSGKQIVFFFFYFLFNDAGDNSKDTFVEATFRGTCSVTKHYFLVRCWLYREIDVEGCFFKGFLRLRRKNKNGTQVSELSSRKQKNDVAMGVSAFAELHKEVRLPFPGAILRSRWVWMPLTRGCPMTDKKNSFFLFFLVGIGPRNLGLISK